MSTVQIFPHPERPGVQRLACEIMLPRPIDDVFEFFGDAAQLQTLTPDWLHFQIITPLPIVMEPGRLIDYRIRLHGVPIGWRTEIAAWEPPLRFVDQQLRGPYRLWHHEHRFESTATGTRVIDIVDYRVPGGWLIDRLFVRRDLRRIFEYRHHKLEELLGTTNE
ncbi:MAG: SRPBCC family protein [Planctomycetaceae bacterium]